MGPTSAISRPPETCFPFLLPKGVPLFLRVLGTVFLRTSSSCGRPPSMSHPPVLLLWYPLVSGVTSPEPPLSRKSPRLGSVPPRFSVPDLLLPSPFGGVVVFFFRRGLAFETDAWTGLNRVSPSPELSIFSPRTRGGAEPRQGRAATLTFPFPPSCHDTLKRYLERRDAKPLFLYCGHPMVVAGRRWALNTAPPATLSSGRRCLAIDDHLPLIATQPCRTGPPTKRFLTENPALEHVNFRRFLPTETLRRRR